MLVVATQLRSRSSASSGRGARVGEVGGDPDVGCRGEGQGLEGDGEVADDGVADRFGSRGVGLHRVSRPPGAELGAVGGELADQRHEGGVGGVVAGDEAQGRHDLAGAAFPVE